MNELPRICDFHGRENEPCYGKIEEYLEQATDKWITFCEGHQAVPSGGAYVPRDPVRRIIFSKQNQRIRQLEEENATLWKAVRYADEKLKEKELQEGEIEIPPERLEILKYL